MKKQSKVILFDIDSTLLVSGGTGHFAIDRAFEEIFGIREAWGTMNPDGKTDPLLFQEIAARVLNRSLDKNEYAALCKRYIFHFRSEIEKAPFYRLMPGVRELLEILAKQKRHLLGIETGNIEPVAWMKLSRGGLHGYFNFGGFGSDASDRQEIIRTAVRRGEKLRGISIHFENLYIVGDAPQDIVAGKALGAHTIAVNTGHTPRKNLADCSPDYLLADLSQPGDFLKIFE